MVSEQIRQLTIPMQIKSKSKQTKYSSFDDSFMIIFSLQINKLEADVQRLNQAVEKQKASEMQLRTQISDLKNIRKDLEDVRNENSDIKTKFVDRFDVF